MTSVGVLTLVVGQVRYENGLGFVQNDDGELSAERLVDCDCGLAEGEAAVVGWNDALLQHLKAAGPQE